MSNIFTFRGYNLEYYLQPNNTYWGICRELGIRVREKDLEALESKFHRQVEKMKYHVYLSWICDEEDYYCTDDQQYSVENLLESLPKLIEEIEKIESRSTILSIKIEKL